MRAPCPAFAFSLVLLLSVLSRAAAQTVLESESSRGLVRIAILPMAEAGAIGSDSSGIEGAAAIKPSPIEAIEDFTSYPKLPRQGEALLEVYFLDHATGEELRFPLMYSELRRYLKRNPVRYLEGTRDERTVSLIGDLARSLRIRMKDPGREQAKP